MLCAVQWVELRMRIREIAQVRVLLNREGWQVGKDLVHWLCRGASAGAFASDRTEPGLGHGLRCRSTL